MSMLGRILESLKSGLNAVSDSMSAESLFYYDVFGANPIEQQNAVKPISGEQKANEDTETIGSQSET